MKNCTSNFAQWLRELDPSGTLDIYCEIFEETYDDPNQVLDLYVSARGDVDDQLFEDVGISNPTHRQLMQAKLSGSNHVPNGRSPYDSPRGANGFGEEDPRRWLRSIEPGGSLDCYAASLSQHYDSMDLVLMLYALPPGSPEGAVASKFFEDLGVENVNHQKLFRAWFEEYARSALLEASDDEGTEDGVPRGSAQMGCSAEYRGMRFSEWLRRVSDSDSGGGVMEYLQVIEDNFDSVEQVIEVYIFKTTEGLVFDTQFFEDVGITRRHHQQLFEAWFEKACGTARAMSKSFVATNLQQRGPMMQVGLDRMDFKAWLHAVDSTGGTMQYLSALEHGYDSPAQVVALYTAGERSGPKLDPQFFADIGIKDSLHRRRFEEWFSGQEEDHSLPPLQTAQQATFPALFSDWLTLVDPKGSLSIYAVLLQESYDSPKQIQMLYQKAAGAPLDPLFFADTGIEDETHQQLFKDWFGDCSTAASSPAKTPILQAFHNWLRQVSSDGTLDEYAETFSDFLKSPEQLMELYIRPGANGKTLDETLFDDAGMENAAHQQLFKDWFAKHCGSGNTDSQGLGSLAGEPSTNETCRKIFASWLAEVSGGNGALDEYLTVFADFFDDPKQVVELYVGQNGKLDPLFFEDVGVEKTEHRHLFSKWFASQNNSDSAAAVNQHHVTAKTSEPVHVAATSNKTEAVNLKSLTFVDWLKQVGDISALGRYQAALEQNYDDVYQLVELYVEDSQQFDADQFFQDVGVSDARHMKLFEAWFAKHCSRGSPENAAQETKFRKEVHSSRFAVWLAEVDGGTGALASYASSLDEGFDNPEQIFELYIGASGDLDHQFFDDAGIEDPDHQGLFRNFCLKHRSGKSKNLKTLSFGSWLLLIDAKGALAQYKTILEDNFDDVQQITEVYVANFTFKSKQFFEDVLVSDKEHQRLFTDWFSSQGYKAPELIGGNHNKDVTSDEAPAPTITDCKAIGFPEWLKLVDTQGRLAQYKSVLQDNYDDVQQLIDLYSPEGPDGLRTFTADQFFDDIGVDGDLNPKHQQLFRAWFEMHCQALNHAMVTYGFPEWLREVDCNGELDSYSSILEKEYDDPAQILALYGEATQLDGQFFQDVNLTNLHHQKLFERWFQKHVNALGWSAPPAAQSESIAEPEAECPTASEVNASSELPETFGAWLRMVHPSVAVDKYEKALDTSFDHPAQLVELYLQYGRSTTIDPMFFKDVDVRDSKHQALFDKWFAAWKASH